MAVNSGWKIPEQYLFTLRLIRISQCSLPFYHSHTHTHTHTDTHGCEFRLKNTRTVLIYFKVNKNFSMLSPLLSQSHTHTHIQIRMAVNSGWKIPEQYLFTLRLIRISQCSLPFYHSHTHTHTHTDTHGCEFRLKNTRTVLIYFKVNKNFSMLSPLLSQSHTHTHIQIRMAVNSGWKIPEQYLVTLRLIRISQCSLPFYHSHTHTHTHTDPQKMRTKACI